MKKIYSILALAMIAFTAVWAATTGSEDAVKVWNFSEWEQATYQETVTIDDLTIVTVSGKKVQIDENTRTIEGVEYTQRLKFGGKTDWNSDNTPKDRALTFEVSGPTTVEVALSSASSTGTGRHLNVYNASKANPLSEEGFEAPTEGADVVTFEYTGEEATTLIVAVDGGINIYFIRATTKVESDQPGTGNDENDPMQNDQEVAVDVLTAASLGVDASSKSYGDYTATLASGATYSANCMQNANGSIQLRSNNNNSGIVTTVSGGKAAYVAVTWDASTTPARTLQVYGKNEPYEAPTDLYDEATAGTLIGIIGVNTDDNPNNDLAITDEYKYIGIRSGYGALYAESIEITWLKEAPLKIDNFVALCDIPAGTPVTMAADFTVVVANEAVNLLWDGTSYYGARFENAVEAGDIIAAGWKATVTEFGLQAEEEVVVKGTAETLPEAIPVTAEDVKSSYYVWNYVTLENVYLAEGINDDITTAEFVEGVEEVHIYNALEIDPVEPGTYNVTGFWMELPAISFSDDEEGEPGTGDGTDEDNMGVDHANIVFVPVSVEVAPLKIDNFVALVDVPVGTLVVVEKDVTVVVANEAVNLLWDGTSYYGARFENAVEAGKVIAAGWMATATEFGLQAEEEVTVAGDAVDMPEAIPVTAEDVKSSYYVWNYVTLENVYLAEGINDDITTAEFVEGVEEVHIYNALEIDPVEPGTYNVTGFWMELPAVSFSDDEEGEEGEPGTGDGTDEDNMGVDHANIVFVPVSVEVAPLKIDNFLALEDIPANTQVVVTCDATVVVAADEICLIWDGTTYYGAQFNDAVSAGNIVAGGWNAIVTSMGLMATAAVEVSGDAETLPEPTPVDAENVRYSVYNFGYETLLNVYVPETIDMYGNGTAILGDEDINVWDVIGVCDIEEGSYNITGFWFDAAEMLATQNVDDDADDVLDDMGVDVPVWFFVPTAIEVAPVVVEDFVSMEDIPEEMPFVIGMETTVAHYEDGFALLYDGTSYYGSQFDQDLNAGDVIAAGWVAVKYSGIMISMDEVTVSGKAEAPAPMEVTADNFNESIVNFNYVKIMGIIAPEDLESGEMDVFTFGEDGQLIIWDMFYTFSGLEAGKTYDATGFWMDVTAMLGGVEPTDDADDLLDDMGVDAPVYMFIPFSFAVSTNSIIGIEAENGNVQYFNINGVRVAEPKAGDVIIRVANGKASKVIIK